MTSDRYRFILALTDADIQAYFDLRRTIFCEEQGIFEDTDTDSTDQQAYPIIAVDHQADDRVVGVVRIYESEPRQWYGGRLGVHADYRRVGRIGKGLIHQAVTTANTWGCDRFLATVQQQNVRFFQRLHWQPLREIEVCDRPHHLMEAELDFYPPGNEPRPALRHATQVAS
ncbi:MAG: GNAT family N-acetyltransferase [Kaiparowitsia implicata GSE-PSE-MK54-09C]|jgi:putative N-acetyltransferase (TIGR04045 family)|nr:GNAT family N-acetyltransferase [Kaiparowitsia implicata GSE-PSE-MK54-09C]